jgi:hypothetical protein
MSASTRLKKDAITVRDEEFHYREWTGTERAEFTKRCKEDPMLAAVYLSHRCTFKPDGTPMWPKESDAAGEPTEITDAISAAVCKLSGLVTDDEGKPVPAKKA